MATVRMKKGDKYADIFDSPETIKQAQKDGYSLVEKPKSENKAEPPKNDTAKENVKNDTTKTVNRTAKR